VQLHQPDILHTLAALDAHILVVSFADLERLRHWVPYFRGRFLEPSHDRHESLPSSPLRDPFERTRFLSDSARTVYHAYGLGRNAIWRVYGPGILWQYLKWGLQGKPIHIRDDTLQRGGNFVVGRDGLLTLAHTGRDQSDRPSSDAILAAIR
jgi:hypothetical protein